MSALEANAAASGIELFGLASGRQGIVHVIGPELGLTQPGMTIACGDSHTSTHGAFGAIAFGIGTSQVRDLLATQTLAMDRPKVRRIKVDGRAREGRGGQGPHPLHPLTASASRAASATPTSTRASAVRALGMEARMTLCNMSIEGGARAGYVSPDETTFEYMRGRPYAPAGLGLGQGPGLLALDRQRRRRLLRRRGRVRRRRDRAHGHLGHQPRPGHRGYRTHAQARRPAARAPRGSPRRLRPHGLRRGR